MHRIVDKRHAGKTAQLIRLCMKLNEEHGMDDTIIVTTTRQEARRISEMAEEMGYKGMPFPIAVNDLLHSKPTFYRRLLIDDMERCFQKVASPWIIDGFTASSEDDELTP